MDHERRRGYAASPTPHVLTAFVTMFTCQRSRFCIPEGFGPFPGEPNMLAGLKTLSTPFRACLSEIFRFFCRLICGHFEAFYASQPRKRKPVRLKPWHPYRLTVHSPAGAGHSQGLPSCIKLAGCSLRQRGRGKYSTGVRGCQASRKRTLSRLLQKTYTQEDPAAQGRFQQIQRWIFSCSAGAFAWL